MRSKTLEIILTFIFVFVALVVIIALYLALFRKRMPLQEINTFSPNPLNTPAGTPGPTIPF